MDKDKAIRSAKLTAAGILDKARARTAVTRAGGQIAPSKYLPNVPRQVHAGGGKVAFMQGNHPDVPDVVYHGNAPQIAYKGWTSDIDHEQTQKNLEAQNFREFKPSGHGSYGAGIYLSDSPKVASDFAQSIRSDQKEPQPFGQVLKLHVSMKQPFTDDTLRHPEWKAYIKRALTRMSLPKQYEDDIAHRDAFLKALNKGNATVRDLFLRESQHGTMVNQFGQDDIHKTIRNSGFDGIIAHRPDGSKEYVAFKPEQIKSAIGNQGTFDPNDPDITKAEGGAVDFVKDNPGGDWLANKQNYAFEYPRMKGIDGAITGWMGGKSDLFLPTHVLKSIEPLNNEKRVAGEPRFDDLMSSVSKEGFDPHQKGNKVVVAVNHRGQPFVLEGNTRVAVAHAMGVPSVKAEVRYWNGAEEADGPMHPDKVSAMASDSPDITKSGGGDVEGNDDGITAYHGSAYDFPQFDIGKLGTGTGHQAYGHGLYFAGDENDAKNYREMLKDSGAIDIEHESHKLGIPLDRDAQADLRSVSRNVNGDPAAAARALQARNLAARAMPQEKLADLIDRHRKSTSGHMYKVKLNVKPEEMLDWNKPLSEQHPNVQAALSRTMPDYTIKNMAGLPHAFANGKMIEVNPNGLTGRDAYVLSRMGKSTESSNSHQDAKAASEHLLSEGIKGIRYKEGGGYNYVMFHHDPVQVTDKYEYGGTVGKEEDGRENGDFEVGKKYNGVIPQIKYLPVHAIERQPSEHEVSRVSDDVAKNMDFSEPVDATAFRYSSNHSEDHPSVALQNGHHRLAAARQTGRPHLPVTLTAVNAKGEKLNALKAMSDEIERSMITKANGGSIDAALALTRRFTKDGKAATLALKPKGK